MPVPVSTPLLAARFRARPNRFVVRALLDGGDEVMAHLPDPGRLKELLIPGAQLRLAPAPAGAVRSTSHSVRLVRAPGVRGAWVCVETQRANRLAEDLLQRGVVRGAPRGWRLSREVRSGKSRFDFTLDDGNAERIWIEVKSVTYAMEGTARFPDAPTERGRRHVMELTEKVTGGERAMILFVVQRPDARCVRPYSAIDPDFAQALHRARDAGVLLRAVHFRFDAHGNARHLGALPVRV